MAAIWGAFYVTTSITFVWTSSDKLARLKPFLISADIRDSETCWLHDFNKLHKMKCTHFFIRRNACCLPGKWKSPKYRPKTLFRLLISVIDANVLILLRFSMHDGGRTFTGEPQADGPDLFLIYYKTVVVITFLHHGKYLSCFGQQGCP